MQTKLTDLIITKKGLDQLTDEIEILKDSLFKTGPGGFETTLKSQVRSWVAEIISEEIKSYSDNKEAYLDNLLAEFDKSETIKVIIAFEPTRLVMKKIYDFIKPNIGSNFVLDFGYDNQIIAGAIIAYRGKYRDFSFRRIFNRELEKSRGEILAILDKSKLDQQQKNQDEILSFK